MLRRSIVLILSAVFYIGCRQSVPQLPFDDIVYVESFPHSYEIGNGTVMDFDKIGVQDIMVCDSLMLISSQNPKGFISAVNLDTGLSSKDFFRKGNGPGEILYPPFFSAINKVSHNGKTSLILNDGKGKLICCHPEDLFGENYPEVEVVADSVSTGLFYSLYVNDSTYICRNVSDDASRQERYLMISGKRFTTESMDKLNRLSIPIKGDGYMFNILSSFSRYEQSQGLVVEASLMLNTIHLYSLEEQFERTICYGRRIDSIDEVFRKGMPGLRSTFTRLNVYDGFFAVMYDGGKMYRESNDGEQFPVILIFDWDGNPMAKLTLPDFANVFDIDIRGGVLYTLDRENEIIRKYDIGNIMNDIDCLY